MQPLETFLSRTALPSVPAHLLTALKEDFAAGEIRNAISSLPPGKSPGPDGYTAKFYKTLSEELHASPTWIL